MARPTGTAQPLPMAIVSDEVLLEDLLRLAANAGVRLEVVPDPAAARPRYAAAPLVILGLDEASACARARLPRRPGLIVVGRANGTPPPWRLADEVGAEHIAMLPAAEPWLVDRLAAVAADAVDRGLAVAVLGGRGGAGASVLAAALAVTSARTGQRTLLVDADPLGGGVDLVLGWESIGGLRWPELVERGPDGVADALPVQGELAVLSFDRDRRPPTVPTDAMATALDAGRRERDLIVVDLPRHLDDTVTLALAVADRGLLVVPAELRACAAAARVAALAAPHCPSLAVVARGPAPGGLRAKEVAEALGLPLAGSLRAEPGLDRALERGVPPAADGRGPLADLCRRLLAEFRSDGSTEVAA